MSVLSKIAGFFTGGVVDTVADVADRFIETDDEKRQFKLQVQGILQQREAELQQTLRSELQAKERIIVAEMSQGDNYTKRARPTLIYFGMLMIFVNYVLVPLIQSLNGVDFQPFDLPVEFWFAWGGAVSVYSVGRSMEKRGSQNRFSGAVTGQQKIGLLDE